MADFMRRRAAEVIPGHIPARHGPRQDITPIQNIPLGCRRRRHTRRGETAETQQRRPGRDARGIGPSLQQGLVVDVERGIGAAAQGTFHGPVVAVGRPRVVGRARDAQQPVSDRGVGVGARQVRELRADHRVRHVVGRRGQS